MINISVGTPPYCAVTMQGTTANAKQLQAYCRQALRSRWLGYLIEVTQGNSLAALVVPRFLRVSLKKLQTKKIVLLPFNIATCQGEGWGGGLFHSKHHHSQFSPLPNPIWAMTDKRKCDQAVENAVKPYDEEMENKLKSTKTEEDLQRFDEAARVDANEIYKDEFAYAMVNALELYEEGYKKLEKDLNVKFEKHRKNFNAHKRKCNQAVENAVKSYDQEMQQKVKSTKTEEDFQRFDEAARVNANEKYKDEVSLDIVNELELYDEGQKKLKKNQQKNLRKYSGNF
ncbi:unnamed protein product, partial [Meganyctiphanes norvegica]